MAGGLSLSIPPPRSHLVRWAGVLASNSPFRREITLRPEIKKAMRFKDCDKDGVGQGENLVKNYSWSKMLARVFKIDVSKCHLCKADMQLMGAVTDPAQVQRYLKHIGLDYVPPPRAPPRQQQHSFEFDQRSGFAE